MAERAGSSIQTESQTVTVEEIDSLPEDVRTIRLTLKKPKTEKQVKWTAGTVDNENLNKKKSKCCCIYEKPRKFGESSSSESEDECENCFGHVEKKKKNKKPKDVPSPPSPSQT